MKKLRLDPESLVVEEFPTTAAVRALRGTVQGAEDSGGTNDSYVCDGGSGGSGCFDINSISGWDNCICPRQVASAQSPC